MRESKPTPFANMERRELAAKETFVPKVFFNVVLYSSEAHHCLVEWPQEKAYGHRNTWVYPALRVI